MKEQTGELRVLLASLYNTNSIEGLQKTSNIPSEDLQHSRPRPEGYCLVFLRLHRTKEMFIP